MPTVNVHGVKTQFPKLPLILMLPLPGELATA